MTAKCLQLTLSFARGGRRAAISNLATMLAKRGEPSDLCCLSELGCPETEVPDVLRPSFVLGRLGAFDRRALRQLSRLCRERRIDLIHAHDAASLFAAALARAANPRLRLVYTFHRSLAHDTQGIVQRARNSAALLAAQAAVVGSTERQRYFRAKHWGVGRKLVRIPFGVDTERFRPHAVLRQAVRAEWGVDENDTVVGSVGHFGPEKGVDLVLKAYRLMADDTTNPLPRLVVVGEGMDERRREIETLARVSRCGRVILAAFRRDVEACFAGFDIFVHGARAEAFGLVLAEAAAAGLPVVATDVGGVPDIVRDGETGMLVAAEDAPALARAVAELVRDPERRRRMGERAREVATTEYSLELYGQRYAALYADVRAGRRPKGVD